MEINKMLISFSYCRFHVKRKRCYLFVCLSCRLAKPLVDLERKVFSVQTISSQIFFNSFKSLFIRLSPRNYTKILACEWLQVCLSVSRGKSEGRLFFL